MVDPLLRRMVKTATVLKAETETADTPELLARIERLASLLYVQAAEARAALMYPCTLNG
ncbi:MAG: hypothetical protein QOH05_3581 [Acetobacteraceae bacterium]|jgi:hypothetical protein|nr:hypothetical protein [Acetobacteraceae bacterium]